MMLNIAKKQNYIKKLGISTIFFATGFLMFLSLVSYSPVDNAINVVNKAPVTNLMGQYGAILADIMLQSFGVVAYVVNLSLFFFGLTNFYERRHVIKGFYILPLSLLGFFMLAMIIGSFEQYNYHFNFLPAGYVGYTLSHLILKKLYTPISLPIFIAIISLIFTACILTKPTQKRSKNSPKLSSELEETPIKDIFNIAVKNAHSKVVSAKKKAHEEKEAKKEKEKELFQYKRPSITHMKLSSGSVSNVTSQETIDKLSKILLDFGIKGTIKGVHTGPVITLFEFVPEAGIKISRVVALADDIARAMQVISARIAMIKGKESIGIEIPNETREIVYLRSILQTETFENTIAKIPLVLGSTIIGRSGVADLTTMPHLLMAGTTGSGKSIGLNAMISSIIYKLSPERCRFLMIDPKMLELSVYNDIPHLITPVITEPKKAITALKWAVAEMENRYRAMSEMGVKNIDTYNVKVAKIDDFIDNDIEIKNADNTLPYIVLIVDEMADLMLVAGKEIEVLIQRLSQMARAAGIHIIMATQRPSVDVITGIIKANMPTRISYQVTSKIDSRTILGEQGAESLLGKGDMLYMPAGAKIVRLHGPFISEEEIEALTKNIRDNYAPRYLDILERFERQLEEIDSESSSSSSSGGGKLSDDEYYQQALDIVLKEQKCSISYIQRRLRIGYNKAANLVERMESEGVVSPPDATGKRNVIS